MYFAATVCAVTCTKPKITTELAAAVVIFASTATVLGFRLPIISAWEALLLVTVCMVCFYVYPKLARVVTSLEESESKEKSAELTIKRSAKSGLKNTLFRTKEKRVSKLSHEPVHTVVTCRCPYKFHYFTEDLIRAFESQRKHFRYQFAVIFVMSFQEIKEKEMHFKSRNHMATNRHIIPFPEDDEVVNYITAGPNSRHAEDLLMDKLHLLMGKFRDYSHQACEMIVLYTWLLPCDNCKDIIIEKMWPLTRDSDVLLAYTCSNEYSCSPEDEIVWELEAAGLIVRKETYDHVLQAWDPERL